MSRALWWSWGGVAVSHERGTPVTTLSFIHHLGGVLREQKMLKGHLPRVIYDLVH